jgi:hypothetical protein
MPISEARLDLLRCQCGFLVTDAPSRPVGACVTELARSIAKWVAGADNPPINASAPATFWWLERLHSAVARTPSWLQSITEQWSAPGRLDDDCIAWLAAAAQLQRWPEGFLEFLDAFQAVAKHRSTATGISRSFGLLLRDANQLERLGYSDPADALREYLVRHYHRGHLTTKVSLFRTGPHRRRLRDRPWTSQTNAARTLGVRAPTIADLVRRGVLDGNIAIAGSNGRTVGIVRQDSVERLQNRMTDRLTVLGTAHKFGLGRHRVLELIHAGLLRDAIRTKQGWVISRQSSEELLDRIARLAPPSIRTIGWISLHHATRRFGPSGLNLARIVDAVLSGKLTGHCDRDIPLLRGLLLERDELRQFAHELRGSNEAEIGYPLNRLASSIVPGRRFKDVVLRKWIRAGLLNARRSAKAWLVLPTEVARFRATYCLADEACLILGISRSTLGRLETDRQITPAYGRRTHCGAGASVFLRADLERLAAQRVA